VGVESLEARVELVALYGPCVPQARLFVVQSPPEVWTRTDLEVTGYGKPGGDLYLCLMLDSEVVSPQTGGSALSAGVEALRSSDGSPVITSWAKLAELSPAPTP